MPGQLLPRFVIVFSTAAAHTSRHINQISKAGKHSNRKARPVLAEGNVKQEAVKAPEEKIWDARVM